MHWGSKTHKNSWTRIMKTGVIIVISYFCLFTFAVGTANGTGLPHPFFVFLFMIGGGIATVALTNFYVWIDQLMKIADEEE